MNKPLILVTNDDGISAPGLKTLVEVAREIGRVVVIAPDSPQSGQSHSITLEHPLRLKKVEIFDGVTSYECSGTPVDCVKLAVNIVLKDEKIDLCLSGINHGSNASVNIVYSGTMSAAIEGSLNGIFSLGFSYDDYSHEIDLSHTKAYIKKIVDYALSNEIEKTSVLNVNIPNLHGEKFKGVRICKQAEGVWTEKYETRVDPRGAKYYWLGGSFKIENTLTDTDLYNLKEGYISIVPCMLDLTSYKAIHNLKPIEKIYI